MNLLLNSGSVLFLTLRSLYCKKLTMVVGRPRVSLQTARVLNWMLGSAQSLNKTFFNVPVLKCAILHFLLHQFLWVGYEFFRL